MKLKKLKSFHRSENLLEVILALCLFFALVAGSTTLAFRYINSIDRSAGLITAKQIAEQDFEALQSIAYSNWSGLADGAYNIDSSGGTPVLTPDANAYLYQCRCFKGQGKGNAYGLCKDNGQGKAQDPNCTIIFKYKNNAVVSAVYRDADCNLADRGTTDPDTKSVTINITWETQNKTHTQSFTRYFTNWSGPTFCVVPTGGTVITGQLPVSVTGAHRSDNHHDGAYITSEFNDIKITNNTGKKLSIDKAALYFDNPSMLTYLYEDWSYQGHSPVGLQASGAVLEIDNFNWDNGHYIKEKFKTVNTPVGAINFYIIFTAADGTRYQSDNFSM